ncbi:MAG: hypothetical protein IJU10_02210 [Clostridia bacterium]|nr:hypothetical protein [Clostridia bacterium]
MRKPIICIVLTIMLSALSFTFITGCDDEPQMVKLKVDFATFFYDGAPKSVTVTAENGMTEGWKITYVNEDGVEVDSPVEAGIYDVTVSMANSGYRSRKVKSTLTIEKAPICVLIWPQIVPNNGDELVLTAGQELDDSMLAFTEVSPELCPSIASVPGRFSWVSGQELSPERTLYDVIFIPVNAKNYKSLRLSDAYGGDYMLPITVLPAD